MFPAYIIPDYMQKVKRKFELSAHKTRNYMQKAKIKCRYTAGS